MDQPPPSVVEPPVASAATPQTMTMPIIQQQPTTNGQGAQAPNGISADEIALYDRQIRLWGMSAQEKIRNANVLLITIRALGNEIAKNLVLAGIGSLTVLDHETVTDADLGAEFFLSGYSADASPLGLNRAVASLPAIQRLNPRVRVSIDTEPIASKHASFFAGFTVVIATDLGSTTLNLINTATRLNGIPFYAAGSHGLYGFIFADLIEHDFSIERDKSNMPTPLGPETKTRAVLAVSPKPGEEKTRELVTKRETYSTWYLASTASKLPEDVLRSARRRRVVTPVLSCLRALWDYTATYGDHPSSLANASHNELAQFTRLCGEQHRNLGLPPETLRSEVLRSFLQNVGAEVAPAAAVLGGQLAQDVINVMGRNQQPIQNFVVFDGSTMESTVYALHPDGPLGRELLESAAQPVGVTGVDGDGVVQVSFAAPVPAGVGSEMVIG